MKVKDGSYEDGKLKSDWGDCKWKYDTLDLRTFRREYDTNGVVTQILFFTDWENILYVFNYPNGSLKRIIVENNENPLNGPNIEKEFSENGELTFQKTEFTLPNCPDDPSVTTSTFLIHVQNYEHNELINEGQIYLEAGNNLHEDSVETWNFYVNGKISQTKNFPSWKLLYKKAHHCEPNFEVPYKL
jgi:hypothetical protein